MNVLDENLTEPQRQLLRSWRIHSRQIGHEIGAAGMADEQIPPCLRRLPQPTFFTRDMGFFRRSLCHPAYCIACLDVAESEAASFVRRLLRHRAFDAKAKRMGTVVRVEHQMIRVLSVRDQAERTVRWSEQ